MSTSSSPSRARWACGFPTVGRHTRPERETSRVPLLQPGTASRCSCWRSTRARRRVPRARTRVDAESCTDNSSPPPSSSVRICRRRAAAVARLTCSNVVDRAGFGAWRAAEWAGADGGGRPVHEGRRLQTRADRAQVRRPATHTRSGGDSCRCCHLPSATPTSGRCFTRNSRTQAVGGGRERETACVGVSSACQSADMLRPARAGFMADSADAVPDSPPCEVKFEEHGPLGLRRDPLLKHPCYPSFPPPRFKRGVLLESPCPAAAAALASSALPPPSPLPPLPLLPPPPLCISERTERACQDWSLKRELASR